ncbi:mannose-1-phosphate guanylyltransferase [Lonepinella koalarum]|uniref:mannose-1-phosphate guanylyltransferase n=1 Tax=Lonepinella koalarum TaxID=53417 RepID=UPI003F6DCF79
MINLILCGGSGTRLWPLSRHTMPKQFVKLFGEKSLYQMNIERNSEICDKTLIVSNVEQYMLALGQAQELKHENFQYLLEPIGRNTAPAIALACLSLEPDDIVLVTSSDHLIKDESAYKSAVEKAENFSKQGYLVTFGLQPKYPETGFGYIETFDQENVVEFHEKPDLITAKKYVESGHYFWNSGMFCFQVETFLSELAKFSPEIFSHSLTAYKKASIEDRVISVLKEDMLEIPANSIDYAVMEHSKKIKIVCSDFNWSDVGSFDSLADEYKRDENGNHSDGKLFSLNSNNNTVLGKKIITALIDVDDLIIANLDDALLVTKKGSSQKVKNIVEQLKSK